MGGSSSFEIPELARSSWRATSISSDAVDKRVLLRLVVVRVDVGFARRNVSGVKTWSFRFALRILFHLLVDFLVDLLVLFDFRGLRVIRLLVCHRLVAVHCELGRGL